MEELMIRPILVLALLAAHGMVPAQSIEYQSLDDLGWEIIDFQFPGDLTELDTGKVNYLVTISDEGKVRDVNVLETTMPRRAEKIFRAIVGRSLFRNTGARVAPGETIKGTVFLERVWCHPDAGTAPGDIFDKP